MELVISRPAPKDDRLTATRVEVFGDATGLSADGQTYRLVAPPGVDSITCASAKPANTLSNRADNRGCLWLWSGFAQRTHPSNALRCEGKYVPPQVGHESGGSTTGAQGGINKLGTYYCWNRTYDVFMGRWTTPDPAATPWGNLWDNVGNKPLRWSDASGLQQGVGQYWEVTGSDSDGWKCMPRKVPNGPYALKQDSVTVNGEVVTNQAAAAAWAKACQNRTKSYMGPQSESCEPDPATELPGKIVKPESELYDANKVERDEISRKQYEERYAQKVEEWERRKTLEMDAADKERYRDLRHADEDYEDCIKGKTRNYGLCMAACAAGAKYGGPVVTAICISYCIATYQNDVNDCRATRNTAKRRIKEDYETKEKDWDSKNPRPPYKWRPS